MGETSRFYAVSYTHLDVYKRQEKYNKSYITYNDIKDGMDLHFVMSARPNYKRGISDDTVPPSISEKKCK